MHTTVLSRLKIKCFIENGVHFHLKYTILGSYRAADFALYQPRKQCLLPLRRKWNSICPFCGLFLFCQWCICGTKLVELKVYKLLLGTYKCCSWYITKHDSSHGDSSGGSEWGNPMTYIILDWKIHNASWELKHSNTTPKTVLIRNLVLFFNLNKSY